MIIWLYNKYVAIAINLQWYHGYKFLMLPWLLIHRTTNEVVICFATAITVLRLYNIYYATASVNWLFYRSYKLTVAIDANNLTFPPYLQIDDVVTDINSHC